MSTTLDADLLSVEEAASLMRVDRSTIRRWISSGALPGYRVGRRYVRVKRDDLARMIAPAKGQKEVPAPGMRYVASIDEIRPHTPEEQKRALDALLEAAEFRQRLREKYGEFLPGSGELLREIRQERTEQLP